MYLSRDERHNLLGRTSVSSGVTQRGRVLKLAALRLSNAVACALALFALLASIPATAEPLNHHLRIIVPSAPGGGLDVHARAMQAALQAQDLAPSTSAENIPGGGGVIALAKLVSAERGRGDVLMVAGLSMLMATTSAGSPFTFNDVTPIARLTGGSNVVVVAASSPFQTLGDLIRALQASPESISWTGGYAGGTDHTLACLIADAVGVDPRRVNYVGAAAGESNPAIAGGHVSVGIGPIATMAPYVRAGTMRVLAVSSPERDPSLSAPTLREEGVDVVFDTWRVLLAPPGVSAADRQRLEAVVATMVQSPEWRQATSQHNWTDNFLTGPALAEFIQTEDQRIRRLFRRLGSDQHGSTKALGPYALLVLGGLFATVMVLPKSMFQPIKAGLGKKTPTPRAGPTD